MAEKITITIETGNAAFEGDSGHEVARILRKLANEFENYGRVLYGRPLFDHNGNKVGSVKTTGNRK